MDSIEQPGFDTIPSIDQNIVDTADRTELIEAARKKKKRATENGDSPSAENSPLNADDTGSILCSPQNHGLRVIIISSIVFSLAVTVALVLTIYLAPKEISGNAAIVAGDQRCADVGLQSLKDGGNAVDAAISTALCLTVVEPQHSGLGGGGFAIVHDHKFGKSSGYDFRETAPASLTKDTLNIPGLDTSILSTGVPGMLKGLAALHKKHGSLPWGDLVSPSIKLAKDGFAVSEELALSLRKVGKPGTYKALAKFVKNGEWKSVNDTVSSPFLASVLLNIKDDPNTLYTGVIRDLVVQDMTDQKGIITEKDLENYSVLEVDVLQSKLRDLTVLSLPPPATGPLLSLILNMAQKYVKETDQSKTHTAGYYHKLIETFKFAFGQRSLLGDPAVEPGVAEEVKYLLSDGLAAELVAKIGNSTHSDPAYYGPSQPSGNKGTSHISVFDSSELMVSLTLSTGDLFGNKMALSDTGFFLNNNLAEFSLASSMFSSTDRNKPAPNKRPMSGMSPAIIYNQDHPCDRRMVLGGVHGAQTLTAVAQVIIDNFLFEDKLPQVLSAPRLHNQLFPNGTQYEKAFASAIVKDLEQRGHDMKKVTKLAGEVTGVRKTNDDLSTGIDPRSLSAEAHY